MRLSKKILLPMFACSLFSTASFAAVVDGAPSFNTQSDTGLYVWRSTNGLWNVRLVAGSRTTSFNGTFEAKTTIGSLTRISLESSDVASISPSTTLRTQFAVTGTGVDGASFSVASNGALCLRGSGNAYLGSTRSRVTLPADLTGNGACGTTGGTTDNTGLYLTQVSSGSWRSRLISDKSSATFTGTFQATQTIQSIQRVGFETGDTATISGTTISFKMSVSNGGNDGVDFTVANGGGVCLRDTAASQVAVYMGSPGDAVRVTLPADLSNNGACGTTTPPPPPPPTGGRKFNPGHYVEMMQANDGTSKMAETVKPGVKGFMKRYTWRELEPTQGNYNFNEIVQDLNFVQSQGLHFIVLIEDKSFNGTRPGPDYLSGTDYTRANRAGGYTLVRWNPFVVTRMKALHAALGARFNSNPAFEGVATQETAPGFEDSVLTATGYSATKYRDALIDVLSSAGRSMPNSRVFWFMNFLPQGQDYLDDIGRAIAPYGGVMGGPDVLPDDEALTTRVYPIYHQLEGTLPLFGRTEPIGYHSPHETSGYSTKFWTPLEIFRYARDNLKVDYKLWVRLGAPMEAGSYDFDDALPVIQNNPVF